MIQKLKTYITQKGYTCADGLVENYYLSLQSRPFVLLTGYSDTDKTLLPRLFAEAVGATAENGRYLQLAVSPDWMDSSDLFGWLNLEGKFIPGVIIDFLNSARQDPERPYFLCLDGLLLSRAEYFLRDFVAAVESMGQPEEKPFVNLLYYGRDAEAAQKYGVIPALRNVYTVGTVDIDLEGRPLNRKLLDRVHTLTLYKQDLTGASAGAPAPVNADNAFLETAYFSLEQCPEGPVQAYIGVFEQINRILTGANTYIGYTLRNDGILYMLHNRLTGALPEAAAMDRVICEKVISRLQATAKTQPVLAELRTFCADAGYGCCVGALSRMCDCYEKQGYADYWDLP